MAEQQPTPASPAGGSSSTAAAAGGAPAHTAFPTATELLGRMGAPRAPAKPSSPEAFLQFITTPGPPPVPYLESLANGPLMPPLASGSKGTPSQLLFLNGLDIATLPPAAVQAGTLGFLYVLTARLNVRADQRPHGLLESCALFCQLADRNQLLAAPSRLAEFSWSYLRHAQYLNSVGTVLQPLYTILEGTLNNAFYNPVHAPFLEACLYTRQFQFGRSTLSWVYIAAYEGTSYVDILTFHYHAGTLAAVLGDFERATAFFSFAVAVPTTVISAIQVASAKRALLTELLSSGRHHQFPKDTTGIVSRYIDKGIPDYVDIARAYDNKDWKVVREVSNRPAFAQDFNAGLVQQIVASIPKQRILDLRKTYSRLTLAELAAKVDNPEQDVVGIIQRMVAAKETRATVAGDIVTFLPDDDYASPENMVKLQQARRLASWFNTELEIGNRNIGLNKKWLAKQARSIDTKDKPRGPTDTMGRKVEEAAAVLRGVGSNMNDMGF